MITKIYKIDENSLRLAKDIIVRGDCVAFPTETVYGLGANAYSSEAVDGIYKIKGRPSDNPLIVHVHKDFDITSLVEDIPKYSKELAKAYLPGPLTMIYKSKNKVAPNVSCGLDTLAIRVPSHEGAQKFLRCVDLPIAAPSANVSMHVSPVTAKHVLDDLNGKIECILDGGRSLGGIESTVLDCTKDVPVILRQGLISQEMIISKVGACFLHTPKEGEKVLSPGMKYKHYSPKCETRLFNFDESDKAIEAYDNAIKDGKKAYILCDDSLKGILLDRAVLSLGKNPEEMVYNLYLRLREGESADIIFAIAPKKTDGIMAGFMNRLNKACGGHV